MDPSAMDISLPASPSPAPSFKNRLFLTQQQHGGGGKRIRLWAPAEGDAAPKATSRRTSRSTSGVRKTSLSFRKASVTGGGLPSRSATGERLRSHSFVLDTPGVSRQNNAIFQKVGQTRAAPPEIGVTVPATPGSSPMPPRRAPGAAGASTSAAAAAEAPAAAASGAAAVAVDAAKAGPSVGEKRAGSPLRARVSHARTCSPSKEHVVKGSHPLMAWRTRKFDKPGLGEKDRRYTWMEFMYHLRQNPDNRDFIYLQPAKTKSPQFDPYDLDIVLHSELDSPFFYTMSSVGVTLFRDNDAEFVTLDQWESDYHFYKCIIKLNVFFQYKKWKSFAVWKHFVRRKKKIIASKSLQKLLFTLNPVFQKVLLQIRGICENLLVLRFLKLEAGVIYTLEKFLEAQDAKKEECVSQLLQLTTGSVAAMREACIRDLALLEQEIMGQNQKDAMSSGSPKVELIAQSIHKDNDGMKMASVAAKWKRDKERALEAKENQETFAYLIAAAKRSEQTRLINFVRVADYLIADTLRQILTSSLTDLLRKVAHHSVRKSVPAVEKPLTGRLSIPAKDTKKRESVKKKAAPTVKETPKKDASKRSSSRIRPSLLPKLTDKGKEAVLEQFFELALVLENDQLVIAPSYLEIEKKLELLLKGMIDLLRSLQRLLFHPQLDGVVDKGDADVENLAPYTDLIGETQLGALNSSIKGSLALAFKDSEVVKAIFMPYVELCIANRGMTFESLEQEVKAGTRTLDHFREDMTRLLKQIEDINALPFSNDVGILHLSSVQLKATLLPFPQKCLQAIHTLLPQMGAQSYQVFIDEVHEAEKRLTVKPTKVEEFVAIADFLQTMHDKKDDHTQQYNDIVEIYMVMNEFKIPVPDYQYASYQMMNADFNSMKAAMEAAELGKADHIKNFSADLAKEVVLLRNQVADIRQAAQHKMILDDTIADKETVLAYVKKLSQDIAVQKAAANRIHQYQLLFQVEESRLDDLAQAADEVDMRYSLWFGLEDLIEKSANWSSMLFEKLEIEEVEETITKYAKLAVKLERGILPNPVVQRLRKMVDDFRRTLPAIQSLRNRALKERHWKKIEAEIGRKFDKTQPLTLGKLLEYKVMDFQSGISNISNEATQEEALEELLSKVQDKWQTIEFVVKQYKDFKDTYVLGGVDDVIVALEDSMVTMNTVTSSRYVGGIRNEVEKMENQLKHFGKVLDQWLECQKQWMYLESIFSAPDIQRQLPNESKAFNAVDKQFKDIMKRTHDRANALQAGTTPGWLEAFQRSNETLEQIQKNLEDYLETKRMAFPRFYFLSNDELLEILAQTRNVQAVQPHMSKCFDGIRRLDFGEDPKSIDIYGMVSGEGERISLGKNLKARGNVENWLTSVEQAMVASMRRLSKAAHIDYAKRARKEWVLKHAAQIVVLISQVYWSDAVEAALASADVEAALVKFRELCISQLADLSVLVRMDLLALERKILTALITIDVHARDIVETMVRDKIFKSTEFGWQMQLRYYWDDELDDCVVRQTNARFTYAYEYLGAQPRLVITPLTDRCYMTLTGALHMKLGGAPAGPAGTGKTETTKDLGKALGIQCVVFNCGDNLDYKFMGKFFAGLAQCGAWACFDEFNRIDIEVLSVVAQQLLTIQNALKSRVSKFMFEGREIKLLPTCGVFITMNPGYAGRTELPDNLKVLFRSVSMMIPDYALVAEVMLFSEGFANAKILSRKMVKLYKLSSEQLSQQDHYDFGMRAVKSVLVMAGALKRANPDLNEDVVLIRAFKDSNLPKFLAQDVSLFLALIADLFPGVEIPAQDFGELMVAIQECLLAVGLQPVSAYVIKVIQLFETMNVRFGVMLVGPTGGGKTTCYQMLRAAMTKLRQVGHKNQQFQLVHTYVLNPKSIKMGELYGEYNLLTNEWTDGLGSTIIRQCVADTTMDRKWVVFDGPVDAIWIENLNTVLDDNCVLCLPNGERIKLNPTTMRMLFEVADLAVASPATVSRCGMVYVPPEELGWRPYVQSWLQRLKVELSFTPVVESHIYTLFDTYVDLGIKFLRVNCKENIPSVNINIVTSLCQYMEALFQPHRGLVWQAKGLETELEVMAPVVNRVFAFAYIWSIGGNIDQPSIDKFDSFFRGELETVAAFPGGDTVFEFYVNFKDQLLSPWEDVIPAFTYKVGVPFFSLIVPTLDTTRLSFLLEINLEVDRPVLYQGVSGVGKSAIVMDTLVRLKEKYMPIVLNFSAQTTSIATQEAIESKLEKKRKTRYGAPIGKKIACFIDDVNMPQREKYFAQPPIELLRQFLDFKGFYDRQLLIWKDIEDMTLISACAPPGGGRNEVTARFFRHFSMICVQPPSETALRTIFGGILGGFLQLFAQECKSFLKPIVDSSIEIYMRISQELLPTPTKSHYTFNLRDVSKVFQVGHTQKHVFNHMQCAMVASSSPKDVSQGILMVKPMDCNTKRILRTLWIHECMRVFHDRLVNDEDRRYFTGMLHELLKRSFEEISSFQEVFEDSVIMFADYLRPGYAAEDRRYEQVQDASKLPLLFKDYLEDYNMSTTRAMRLVFFKDAIDHVSRITRILRQPRGNAMLVGVGGSGKQSLTRFACSLSEYKCFQIELTKGYSNNEFREDLKKVYQVAGVDGKPITFLFTDTQIVNEGFVEDINNLLNSGEIPGLFAQDEKERIGQAVREYARSLGYLETKDVLYSTFINRARENVHVVICMSPVGEAFRSRCRQFPSLISCCTIDWFNEWPEEALLSVSNHFLAPLDLGSDQVKKKIAKMCVGIHTSVGLAADKFYMELRRKYYITPKSYLDCVNLYIQLLEEKRKEMDMAQDRFMNGLQKLKETNVLIDSMKIELGKLQPILKEKGEITDKLVAQVASDQEAAEKVKNTVETEEAQVKVQAANTQLIKDDALKDLELAMPALNAAVEALNSLSKSDITEVKSFKTPPGLVLMTMEAVCVLLGEKPEWDAAKKIMGDVSFIKRLVDYDKDSITPLIQKKLQKYIMDPNFLPEIVQKQSAAATSLCMWVRAMDVYANVNKIVAPKKEVLRKAEAALKAASENLATKQEQLRAVEEKVDKLKKNLEIVEADQRSLQQQAQLTENRLIRAGKLTSALGDESVRWKSTAKEIGERKLLLVGDVFLCAACISYYGAFSGPYRKVLLDGWIAECKAQAIPVSDNCSLRGILASPVEVREWSIWGLPIDDVSIDNGILVTRGKRWPLMIDPQGQANSWIKAMESKNGLRVVRLTDGNLLRTLESSIRIGNPVLLEEIGDALDPALEPILQKQIFEKKGRWLIRLGDTDVDYDMNFKLYMTSKMSNPHYLPEVCIKVTLVNFTVTAKGLEDQLLGDVVRKERSDLEEQNDRLVVSISSDKKQLKDLEDKILKLLKESEGNILDDEVLINTLNNSKTTSTVISARVKQAEITEKEITAARELYRIVAYRGSILYFVISDLALVDPMYQYSLTFFSQLFNHCIDISERSDDLATRLNNMIVCITEFLYSSVSRGLFEQHKITFAFLMCSAILRAAGEIRQSEWGFFLVGTAGMPAPDDRPPNPAPEWITTHIWNHICALEELTPETFTGLAADFAQHPSAWKEFFRSPEPHLMPLPSKWQDAVDPFQRLIVVRIMREEKFIFGCEEFIKTKLGPHFIGSSPLQLDEVFKDTTNTTPVIFILTTGADPTGMLQRFGEKVDKKPGEKLHMISLGQGQGPIAETLVSKSRKTGDWVCLQNCHLARSWMPTMERIIEKFIPEAAEIHPEFRLWLTSFPSSDFPIPVLQNGIKITNEPPKGVRANLLQSYANISVSFLEECTKLTTWKKLVFSISFFHAVIQERRKYGPLGWNVKYDFNSSDLECALQTLHMFLEEQPEIPWPALLYVTGEINYGGRVTDDLDRRCLMSTLRHFYDIEVLKDLHPFTSSGVYVSPPEGPYSSYVDYIKTLPTSEAPDVFGMHENANLTFQLQETQKIINTVLSMQPRMSSSKGGKSSDEIVAELAAKILAELPAPLRPEESKQANVVGPSGAVSSLTTVLFQEAERFNRLLNRIRITLVELQKAIKGLVVMSADLESMFHNFLNNQIPALWTAVAYPSLKPLSSWVKDFHRRMEFFAKWIKEGEPKSFWLPGFFFPQGFMTGALQNHARKYKIPIDTLNFGFKVLPMENDEDVDLPPEDGLFISGLYIDGARWDRRRKCLAEANPGEMYSRLPVVHFIPIVNYKPPDEEYQCPLYKTHVRAGVLTTTGASSNFILLVSLIVDPKTTPDFWVLQGVACLCQLAD